MVFVREMQGQTLAFGASGKLIMNAVVMYDHQTDSLWSQFLAIAVDRSFTGAEMELLFSQLTNWGAWLDQHPDTKLLDRTIGHGAGRDPYMSYYNSTSAGVLGEAVCDSGLPRKELVIGLDHGQQRTAYAFSDFEDARVVNDVYDHAPVVVTHDPLGDAVAAFSRTVDSRTLTFETLDRVTMRDIETGSTGSSIRGEALSGELAGAQLEHLPLFVVFWFSWTDFYPGIDLYDPNTGPPS
jgi:hypothetical protein